MLPSLGANAWQLTAASLVALQSVPGLVVMYAGIMKGKWAINSAFMAFYAFASVLICWVVWAYKMGFGKQWIPLCGVPGPIISMHDLLKQAELPAAGFSPNFPMSTMVYFQFVFAAITLVIMVRFLCPWRIPFTLSLRFFSFCPYYFLPCITIENLFN